MLFQKSLMRDLPILGFFPWACPGLPCLLAITPRRRCTQKCTILGGSLMHYLGTAPELHSTDLSRRTILRVMFRMFSKRSPSHPFLLKKSAGVVLVDGCNVFITVVILQTLWYRDIASNTVLWPSVGKARPVARSDVCQAFLWDRPDPTFQSQWCTVFRVILPIKSKFSYFSTHFLDFSVSSLIIFSKTSINKLCLQRQLQKVIDSKFFDARPSRAFLGTRPGPPFTVQAFCWRAMAQPAPTLLSPPMFHKGVSILHEHLRWRVPGKQLKSFTVVPQLF